MSSIGRPEKAKVPQIESINSILLLITPPPCNGKKFLDQSGDLDVQIALNASKKFAQTYPEFVGHKRIYYAFRQISMDDFHTEMMNAARLYQLYPDHFLGFDAVGEEDAGYSHLHYLGEFLKLYNGNTQKPIVPLYLHSTETNWPDDFAATDLADDLVATAMNSYETLLLNAKRIVYTVMAT